MKMEQNQFFNLTDKIREEYIAEATGWKHHGTVQSKASGKVSGDGQMSPADTRAAKRDDRRIRMMAAGGVAVAAAFALTVGAVLHGFGSVPISPETGMSASEQTEGSYNLYGGKGTLRFVGGNPLLLEDDNYYYSPVWEIFRAKKSDANENGAMPMIFDLSKQIVDSEIALYPCAQFSGKPLYYHADEGKIAIYMRDDNGREYEPLFFKQKYFEGSLNHAARAEVTRLTQLGKTDCYFAELTLYDDADGAATKVCAAVLRPESLDILSEEAYSNDGSGWYAAYDEVQNRAYCYYLSAAGVIGDMILYDTPDEDGRTGSTQYFQIHPDSVHVRYPYYDRSSSTASSALTACDGKLYYYSNDAYCEMDAETGEVREISIPYNDFTMIGGKLYAVSDGNVIRVNPDGTEEAVIYSGGNAFFIPPQISSDAIIILTENADSKFDMVVLLSDGSRLIFYADQDNPPAVTEAPAETTVPAETTLPAETTTEAAAVLPLEQIPPHSNEYPVRTAEEVDAILEKGIEDFKQYGRQPIDTAPYLALFDSVPEGEQAEIAQNYLYHMMLNSVDYYDTAEVYMTYAMNGTENSIRLECNVDIPRGTAIECNETGKVFYTVQNGKLTTFPDGIRTVTDIPKHAEFTIPDNDRIAIESGSPNSGFITLRRSFLNELNVAGVAALASLLPQDIAMTHLHDFTQWKITEVGESYGESCGGRKNALIEGMYTDLPFEMKVDLETGILLGVWQYDGNYNLTGYAEIDSIIVDGQWPE